MGREPSQITAVLFDVGGTLLDVADPIGWAALSERLGVAADPEAVAHCWLDGLREFDRPAPVPSPAEFWRWVLSKATGGPVAPSDAERFATEVERLPPVVRLYSDVRNCLQKLRPLTKRIGVVSNSISEPSIRELLRRAEIVDAFSAIVSSGTEGLRKPDPAIFLRGAERVGSRPSQTMYVGDLAYTDAKAATAAGLYGVWLKRDGTGFGDDPPEITSLSEVPGLVRRSRESRPP